MSDSNTQNLPPLLVRLLQCPAAPPDCAFIPKQITTSTDHAESPEFILFDAINAEEAGQLYAMVRTLKPAHSAEIGFCCGGSGMAILQALTDNANGGIHHACDPFQSSYAKNAGLRNVEHAGLSKSLRFHEKFPEEVIPHLPRLQFAFIDASHLFDLSISEFVLVDKKLDVGGVVAFHDLWMPSLRKVICFLLANRNYEIVRPDGEVNSSRKRASLPRHLLSRILRMFPKSEMLFSADALTPWVEFGMGNLALLRKTGDDTRDWRHFRQF